VVAACLAFYQSEIQPVKPSDLREYVVTPTYVGELTLTHSSSGLMAHSTKFNGGYGLGLPNEWARDDLMRKLRPVVYVPFAADWKITSEDLDRGLKSGHTYRVKIFQGEVFEVSDESREILPYAEYASRVERKKEWFLYSAGAVLASAVVLWLAAQVTAKGLRET
jgi:hypothetical protein